MFDYFINLNNDNALNWYLKGVNKWNIQ
jgi:hypothetical protein